MKLYIANKKQLNESVKPEDLEKAYWWGFNDGTNIAGEMMQFISDNYAEDSLEYNACLDAFRHVSFQLDHGKNIINNSNSNYNQRLLREIEKIEKNYRSDEEF